MDKPDNSPPRLCLSALPKLRAGCIGKKGATYAASFRGVTNVDTGGEFTKPAFLVDASDDKSEVLGSSG